MNRLQNTIAIIIKFRIGIITALAIAMIISAHQTFKQLRIDNSLSIWFLEDDPSYKAYINFQEKFGSDEIFVAMIPVANAIGEDEMIQLEHLHKSIEALPYVKTTFSLAKVKYPIYANGRLSFDYLYNKKRTQKGLKNLFSKLPNITSQLVSKDYKNQFFYVQLNPTPTIEKYRKDIANEVRMTIEKHYTRYYLTGPPVLNEAYSKGIYKESLTFGVLTVLIITFMLMFLLPSRRYLLISLIAVAAPVSLLFGLMTSMGFALNMISMLIPTILMVYSVSDIVHIINIYHKEGLLCKALSKVQLLSLSIRKSFTPCFYTTLTTLVGYFALYLSPLPAFKDMGIFTCLGLVLSFVLVYVIAIIGFSFISLEFENTKPVLSHKLLNQRAFIAWINSITLRYSRLIIIIFSVILFIGISALFQIKIDTHSLELLAEGQAKQELRLVESNLGGSSRLQLNISTIDQQSILTKDALKNLESFQNKLEINPLITATVSVVNIKSFLEKRSPFLFQSNMPNKKVYNTLEEIDNNDNNFFKLFSEDLKTAGFTLSLREMKTSELEQIISDVKQDFQTSFDVNKYNLKINGFAVVFAQLNHFILQTQFKSFFVAFFVAFLCLWIYIKSIRTTFLVLIPNMLPLAILAIIMNLAHISLSVTTAMITPIMLGIAMDDTIHLVYKYMQRNKEPSSVSSRMDNALQYTGGALFSTTLALVAGFLIIASSAVPSVRDFGLLCAVSVGVALITDIFYLPALLKAFDR